MLVVVHELTVSLSFMWQPSSNKKTPVTEPRLENTAVRAALAEIRLAEWSWINEDYGSRTDVQCRQIRKHLRLINWILTPINSIFGVSFPKIPHFTIQNVLLSRAFYPCMRQMVCLEMLISAPYGTGVGPEVSSHFNVCSLHLSVIVQVGYFSPACIKPRI